MRCDVSLIPTTRYSLENFWLGQPYLDTNSMVYEGLSVEYWIPKKVVKALAMKVVWRHFHSYEAPTKKRAPRDRKFDNFLRRQDSNPLKAPK